MVFFLLIVMVVFASFMIILNQNTGLEQTTIQAKQLDLDRYTELETVSITNPETAVLNNVVYLLCDITNNGTLPTELVRLWIRDITNGTVGNIILSPSLVLQPGSSTEYFKSVPVLNASSNDQFSIWFETTRGNQISAYPNINQFSGISIIGASSGDNSNFANTTAPITLYINSTKPNDLVYLAVVFDDGNTLNQPVSTPILNWNTRITSAATDRYYYGDALLRTYYAFSPGGPINITLSVSGTENNDYYWAAIAFAISNVNVASPFDNSGPQSSIGQYSPAYDTITTSSSNELVIGAFEIDTLNPQITPGAGFTQVLPVEFTVGATGDYDAYPRSVWVETSVISTPTNNLSVNCTYNSNRPWAIVVDAVKLVVTPPVVPISLSPSSGPCGQLVTVSGGGFAANSRLIATFDGSQVPFSFTTDSSGNIPPGATFIVPQGSAAGNKTVTIIDSKFNYASANFTVTTSNITVSPQSGPVGTTVTVTGSNFITNSIMAINFDGNSIATNPSTVTANATGWFSATFNFNVNDTAGVKQVLASDGVNSASANFTVTPSITLSPTNGPIGSSVNVTGSGFAASQPVIVTFAGSTIPTIPVSFNTNGVGFFNASFTIPTSQTAGGKTVNATDASLNAAIATFTVTPSIYLNPTSGNAGSTVTVSGSGFAGNSALTATFAGSTVTISGTTSTNSSGSFTGANFTVPTSTAGGNQTIVINDANSNPANATYTVNTLVQLITVTMSNSAPSATVTVNGGYPSPSTFLADGTQHSITMVAGAPFTLSFSNNGNTRYGFNIAGSFSATSSSYTASFTPVTVTDYEQFKVTASYSTSDGSTPSASVILSGTQLGSSSYTLTLTTSAQVTWLDAGTGWSVNNPITSGTQRWNAASGTSGTVSSAVTVAPLYYHQYQQTLSYTVVGGGSPSAPTATGTSLGSAYAPALVLNTPTAYWFDASGSITISTLTGTNEQWAPSPATISATSAHTQVVSMYNQYQLTVTASPSGAIGGTFQITYTQLGTTYTNQPQTTTWMPWVDASTTATVSSSQSPVNGYAFSSYINNGVTMNSAQTITLVYIAAISLSPTTGAVGSTVTVTATGMLGSHSVTATFGSTAVTLSTSTTTSSGGLSATFTVPMSTSGSKTVTLTDGTNSPTASFTVTSGVLHYVPITLTNSQSSAVSSGSQVSINVNWNTYSSYLSNPVDNYAFFDSSGNLLPSWLESASATTTSGIGGISNTATSSVVWVEIDSQIAAGGTYTCYLGFYATTSNQLSPTGSTGEAPTLSNTYAAYDNGANVFNAYFNGNTATSSFSVYSGYTLSKATGVSGPGGTTINAIKVTGYNGKNAVFSFNTPLSNTALIAESSFSSVAQGTDTGAIGLVNSAAASSVNNAISADIGYSSAYFDQDYMSSGTVTNNVNPQGTSTSSWLYATLTYTGSAASSWSAYIAPQLYSSTGGYSGTVSNNPLSSASNLYLGQISTTSSSYSMNIYYNFMRARTYLPNGVMPTASFGNVV
jgi:hypothetical protein